mmetsp:Transcript_71699/g.184934  ORF Transcript_71699/g.184934 Transcript_71699/m.184934 type:complete len:234 (-) Transcript_71699:443-1144(-)
MLPDLAPQGHCLKPAPRGLANGREEHAQLRLLGALASARAGASSHDDGCRPEAPAGGRRRREVHAAARAAAALKGADRVRDAQQRAGDHLPRRGKQCLGHRAGVALPGQQLAAAEQQQCHDQVVAEVETPGVREQRVPHLGAVLQGKAGASAQRDAEPRGGQHAEAERREQLHKWGVVPAQESVDAQCLCLDACIVRDAPARLLEQAREAVECVRFGLLEVVARRIARRNRVQ